MRLTRRGRGLLAAVAVAALAAFLHGTRGLDAVVVPGVVALGIAAVQVRGTTVPEIERHLHERGTRGDTVTVRLDVGTDDPVSARIHDEVEEGLDATGNDRPVTLAGGSIEYDLTLSTRGMQSIGPLTIEVTDILGLVSETRRHAARDRILVRPRVMALPVGLHEATAGQGDLGPERGAFEYLREYEPGDPIRDIHWKSSAKTAGRFLVTEFSDDDEGLDAVTVGVEAVRGDHDATADAAASLAVLLLESGLDVGLRTFSKGVAPDGRAKQRDRILDVLARDRYIAGDIPDRFRPEVDFLVRGTEDGVVLEAGDRTVDLGGQLAAATTGGGPAEPTPG
jgi:uncharacterized protein (DUF58 family)